eukprot:5430495-Alexandrium_andersonii.AAC.1
MRARPAGHATFAQDSSPKKAGPALTTSPPRRAPPHGQAAASSGAPWGSQASIAATASNQHPRQLTHTAPDGDGDVIP